MARVAVAGASGFIGRALCERLSRDHAVYALSRTAREDEQRVRWRRCDLFSLLDCERALEGADVAVYLVHSMAPSARLTQGNFADMDLMLADNFARAAKRQGVRQIIYLGGLVPETRPLSPHLASRLEVEAALAAHGVPVTALRAGMVVGRDGPSFRILRRLVTRLPLLVCPAWTNTETRPIALDDAVTLLAAVVDAPERFGETFDIGGPQVTTYKALLRDMARVLGRPRLMIPVPLFCPGLSRLWVSLVTGTSRDLAAPLIESLRHPMLTRDRRLQEQLGLDGQHFAAAASMAIRSPAAEPLPPALPAPRQYSNTVRSVQRLPNPRELSGAELTRAYLEWLPRALWPFMQVRADEQGCAFHLWPLKRPLLVLRHAPDRSSADRDLLYVVGGLLARTGGGRRGRLEFRAATSVEPAAALAAIHDFVPALPWFVYRFTQAVVHLLVMWAFGRHLGASSKPTPDSVKIA